MAEGLQIQIGADVSQAISGLNQVNSAVGKTADQLKKLPQATGQANMALTNLGRVVQDAPFGFIGIANNIDPLLQSFTALKASTGSTSGALKALGSSLLGGAGLGFAVSVATSLLVVFGDKLWGAGKAAKETKSDADKLKDSIQGIFSETAKEASSAAGFVSILKSETESRQRKLEAIKELQKIQPEIFANLKLEGNAVAGLDSAYQAYLANLKNVIAAKIKQSQLEQLIEKQLKLEGKTLVGTDKLAIEGAKKVHQAILNDPRLGDEGRNALNFYYKNQENASKRTAKSLQDDIDQIIKDLTELSSGIKTTTINPGKIKVAKKTKVDLSDLFDINPEIPKTFSDEIASDGFNAGNIYGDQFKRATEHKLTGIDYTILEAEAKKALEKQKIWTEAGKTFGESLSDAAYQSTVIGFEAIGQAISAALTGGNIGNVLASFAQAIGQQLAALGKQILAAAPIIAALKKSLSTLNPALMIPAGIALIALGSTLSASVNKGIGARKDGGPVSGNTPYLVGENGPELFVPSVSGSIIPNHQVGSMGGRNIGGQGGRTSTIIRGQDIILAYARTSRSQSRVNG